ncbi:unnamed protein product [Rhizophagus irregularis]|nr:unnamed protein product [Rhizophagus irregularis]
MKIFSVLRFKLVSSFNWLVDLKISVFVGVLGLSTVAYKILDFGIGRIRLSTVASWMPDFRIGRIGRILGYWTSVEM